jgi:hypothetical protein
MDATWSTTGESSRTDWSRASSSFLRDFPWYDNALLRSDLSAVQHDFRFKTSGPSNIREDVIVANPSGEHESDDTSERTPAKHFIQVSIIQVHKWFYATNNITTLYSLSSTDFSNLRVQRSFHLTVKRTLGQSEASSSEATPKAPCPLRALCRVLYSLQNQVLQPTSLRWLCSVDILL